MASRIHDVRSRGDNRDRHPAAVEAAAVRRSVDAEGQAADYRDARGAQPPAERVGDLGAVWAGAARAHDRHGRLVSEQVQHVGAPDGEQNGRRVGEVAQERRVGVRVGADRRARSGGEPVALRVHVERIEEGQRLLDLPSCRRGDQVVLREGEQPRRPALAAAQQSGDPGCQVSDQEGAPETGIAGVDHAAIRSHVSSR